MSSLLESTVMVFLAMSKISPDWWPSGIDQSDTMGGKSWMDVMGSCDGSRGGCGAAVVVGCGSPGPLTLTLALLVPAAPACAGALLPEGFTVLGAGGRGARALGTGHFDGRTGTGSPLSNHAMYALVKSASTTGGKRSAHRSKGRFRHGKKDKRNYGTRHSCR